MEEDEDEAFVQSTMYDLEDEEDEDESLKYSDFFKA